MSCSVPGCKSNASRKQNEDMFISYHRFPESMKYRKKWLEAIKKQDWIPKNRRICSKHFTLECFVNKDDLKWRRLKPEAVPTLLLPQSLQSSECETSNNDPLDLKLEADSENIPIKVEITNYSTLPTVSVHDMELERVKAQLARTKKRLAIITEVAERRLRKINALKQKNRRMRNKNTEFSIMLETLLKNEHTDAAFQLSPVQPIDNKQIQPRGGSSTPCRIGLVLCINQGAVSQQSTT